MNRFQKNELTTNKQYLKKSILGFIIAIIICLLPGVVISTALFVNAIIYDINIQRARNDLPNTDLSEVRVEGYTLGQYIVNWNSDNFSSILCENGESYGRNTSDFASDSPVASIRMGYPVIDNPWNDKIVETWERVTFRDTSLPEFDSVVEALGEDYLTEKNWRSTFSLNSSYLVYIDHLHNIELRFEYNINGIQGIIITRPDNRGSIQFILEQNALFADGYFSRLSGNRIIDSYYIKMIWNRIEGIFRNKEFLIPISAYFSIPPYFAMWTFPLVWAIYKRRLAPFIMMVIWYPVWYIFGYLSFLAQQ